MVAPSGIFTVLCPACERMLTVNASARCYISQLGIAGIPLVRGYERERAGLGIGLGELRQMARDRLPSELGPLL